MMVNPKLCQSKTRRARRSSAAARSTIIVGMAGGICSRMWSGRGRATHVSQAMVTSWYRALKASRRARTGILAASGGLRVLQR